MAEMVSFNPYMACCVFVFISLIIGEAMSLAFNIIFCNVMPKALVRALTEPFISSAERGSDGATMVRRVSMCVVEGFFLSLCGIVICLWVGVTEVL